MESAELLAAYVCVGVGGFLLIVIIIMLSILIYTGRCRFCGCEDTGDPHGDKTKLKYTVEHEKQGHINAVFSPHSNGKLPTMTSKYIVRASGNMHKTMPGRVMGQRSHDEPHLRRKLRSRDKYQRVKHVHKTRGMNGMGSDYYQQRRRSSSSMDGPDGRQKPYSIRVEEPGTVRRQPVTVGKQLYVVIDSTGRRYRIQRTTNQSSTSDARHKLGRSANVHSMGISHRPPPSPPSVPSAHHEISSRPANGPVNNLRVTGKGIELISADRGQLTLSGPDPTYMNDDPNFLRWSPSMRGKVRRFHPGMSVSRPESQAPSSGTPSRAYTIDAYMDEMTPASSRRSYGDVQF